MQTILSPCRVPWMISPSGSGVTLTHSESGIKPECSVGFWAFRKSETDTTGSHRISIAFEDCYYARVGHHEDSESVEGIGYLLELECNLRDVFAFMKWVEQTWIASGFCPQSGFYYAKESEWLASLPSNFQKHARHYVIDGRDGYVEVIASRFTWQEWLSPDSPPENGPSQEILVASGEGVD